MARAYGDLYVMKAQLEFELAYYDVTVQHVNHNATWTPTN